MPLIDRSVDKIYGLTLLPQYIQSDDNIKEKFFKKMEELKAQSQNKEPKEDQKNQSVQMTNIVICVNNKKKFVVPCPKGLTKEQLLDYLALQDDINAFLSNLETQNIYHVPDKMINIVTKKNVYEKK